ncbi:hypothetical protein FHS20_005226 [Phyllobacterium endophyticum]|nr:hypothetical protein [Phyllobacterium endophyticum]
MTGRYQPENCQPMYPNGQWIHWLTILLSHSVCRQLIITITITIQLCLSGGVTEVGFVPKCNGMPPTNTSLQF